MTQGMVTSQEISVMKWMTADLSQIKGIGYLTIFLSVKEQRVDGSSI